MIRVRTDLINNIRYKIWLWIGENLGVLKKHNNQIVSSVLSARSKLEHAFKEVGLENREMND